MLHLLNKNTRIQMVLFILLTLWSAWTISTQMTILPRDGKMIFYNFFVHLFEVNDLIIKGIALFLIVFASFGLNVHFNRCKFSDQRTYMPGIFFLLFMNCGHFLDIFTPAYFTIFCTSILLMFSLPAGTQKKIKGNVFFFGILISLATLTDFSAFGLILYMLITISIYSISPTKDNLIFLLGLLIPYIYTISVYYLCNSLPKFITSWRELTFLAPIYSFLRLRIIDYICLGFLLLCLTILIIRGRNYYESRLIIIRRAYSNIHLLLIFLIAFMIVGQTPVMAALSYTTLCLSEYSTVAILQKKRRFVYDVLLTGLCVLLWL